MTTEVGVLFADLRGFTARSEAITQQEASGLFDVPAGPLEYAAVKGKQEPVAANGCAGSRNTPKSVVAVRMREYGRSYTRKEVVRPID
jgi:hypothetical protein